MRSTRAVADTNGTSQLDKVTSGDIVLSNKRSLFVGNFVGAQVGVVVGLGIDEGDDRTVGTSTTDDRRNQ